VTIAGAAFLFVLGGALLVVGAELLVRGASRIATAAGISPLVVGLTVVAFGTSSPELAVTVGSALQGEADVALGNVVGSNIANILLILGVSALVAPLAVSQQLVWFDVPLLIVVSVGTILLALDGDLGRWDGALLGGGFVAYNAFLIWQSRRESAEVRDEYETALDRRGGAGRFGTALDVGLIVVGLVLLVFGARWLVDAAVSIAEALEVSALVIGLTVVAVGTSLPELATSVLASVRGARDIAVGNAIGSCLFNLLGVLGIGALVAPGGMAVAPGALTFDMPVMTAVAVAALPIFFTGHLVARWEGGVFVAYYVAYTVYLVLDATRHPVLPAFGAAMTFFVLPLTVLSGVTLVIRAARQHRDTARTAPS
jgi:cation:H+ antiporter